MENIVSDTNYLTLVGHVQSGKTLEEINYCFYSVKHQNIPVIFLVRNITADQLQLRNRFLETRSELDVQILSSLKKHEAVEFLNTTGILISLCNHYQLEKIKQILIKYKGIYNLCIDEVDFSVKTKDETSMIDPLLSQIKEGANHILGATATPFALFSSETNLTKIKKIKPHSNYRGIDTLQINYVKPNISIYARSDYLTIKKIYTRLLQKDTCILLHSVHKTKAVHHDLQDYISDKFPDFTVITYNGDGIRVVCPKRDLTPFVKKKSVNKHGILVKYHIIESDKVYHLFENYNISEVLQILKYDPVHEHKHISIISGHLASRGISFVSSDYSLHLTDQYFVPGDKTHGENLLQSLRILGCYVDNVPLTLWCSENTWKLIVQQNNFINNLINACDNSKQWLVQIQEISIIKPENPITRPKLMQGIRFNSQKLEIHYQKMEKENI